MEETVQTKDVASETSRRKFLKQCGIALLATVAYEVMSMVVPSSASAGTVYGPECCGSCIKLGDTGSPPEVPKPTCVQWFKG